MAIRSKLSPWKLFFQFLCNPVKLPYFLGCCNNVDGDCLLLDDGEGCACPQSIAYTLICKYFRRAVLPAEPELEEDIFNPKDMRRCKICGARYIAGSGRSKYCPDCAAEVHRKQKAAYARKKRSSVDK